MAAGFGAETTAAEVLDGVDLSGRRALVTGGASGIGTETARALAAAGCAVTLPVRDLDAGERVAAEIRAGTGASVTVAALELTDLDAVRAFAAGWAGALDILVLNAGVMAVQELTLTERGHELQLATNHFGHFVLAVSLHAALAAAPAGARVVAVSSSGHLRSPVVLDDLHYRFRAYDPFGAYGQAKTANVLFAVEADRRWSGDGIRVNAVHPGGIATALQRHVGGEEYMRGAVERFRAAGARLKSREQGAATSVLAAASPTLAGVGGRYLEDCHEATVIRRAGEAGLGGVAWYALDADNAARLWDVSLRETAS